MKTICLNTLLALGGSSIEGQTMVFNSFAIVGEIFHISSLGWRKPKSHDYVSDLVRLCLWFIFYWLSVAGSWDPYGLPLHISNTCVTGRHSSLLHLPFFKSRCCLISGSMIRILKDVARSYPAGAIGDRARLNLLLKLVST